MSGDYQNTNKTVEAASRTRVMLADAGNKHTLSDVSDAMFHMPGLETDSLAWRFWVADTRDFGSTPGNSSMGSSLLKHQGSGTLIGLDRKVSDDSLIGISLGGGKSYYSVDNGNASYGDAKETLFALYGAWRDEHLYVKGALDYGSYKNSVHRTATISGFSERLTGHYNSQSYGSEVEIGWRNTDNRYFTISPFIALRYATLSMDSFTEEQANGQASQIGLSYGSNHVRSNPISVGTKVELNPIELGRGADLSGWLRLALVHENSPERKANASFIAAPGYSFTVNGADAPSDSGRVDSGVLLKLSPKIGVFGNFSGSVLTNARSYESSIGLNIQW